MGKQGRRLLGLSRLGPVQEAMVSRYPWVDEGSCPHEDVSRLRMLLDH